MNHIEGSNLIGAHAWNKLVAHYGGCEMPIPSNLTSGSGQKLIALIGERSAEAMIAYAAGDTLYIAAGWERVLGARYAEIKAMRERGLSYGEIARKFEYSGRYSERNIRMILSGERDQAIAALVQYEKQLSMPV